MQTANIPNSTTIRSGTRSQGPLRFAPTLIWPEDLMPKAIGEKFFDLQLILWRR